MLEDHTHQLKMVFNYVDPILWSSFIGSPGEHDIVSRGCGCTHFPPNAEREYEWGSQKKYYLIVMIGILKELVNKLL